MWALSAFWERPKSPESLLLSDYLHALDQAERHVDILNFANWCIEATFISLKNCLNSSQRTVKGFFEAVSFGSWDAEILMNQFLSVDVVTPQKMYTCSLAENNLEIV